jgi:hypothetical protein
MGTQFFLLLTFWDKEKGVHLLGQCVCVCVCMSAYMWQSYDKVF